MFNKLTARNNQKGFTLIEVVLVLAIAGLIFALVFLGVSGAQRSRRDTERKSAAGRLMAAAEQVAGNFNGNYPANSGSTCPATLTAAYTTGGYACTGTAAFASGVISYSGPGFICAADNTFTATGATNRNVAAGVLLETGGANYCVSNQ